MAVGGATRVVGRVLHWTRCLPDPVLPWRKTASPPGIFRTFSAEAKRVAGPARARGLRTRQYRLSLGRHWFVPFTKGRRGHLPVTPLGLPWFSAEQPDLLWRHT